MMRRLFPFAIVAGLLSTGFLALDGVLASGLPGGATERRVGKDLIQVRMDGKWVDFPLMPLADSTCQRNTQDDSYLVDYCK